MLSYDKWSIVRAFYQDWDFRLKKKVIKKFPLRTTKPVGKVGMLDDNEAGKNRKRKRYIKNQKNRSKK